MALDLIIAGAGGSGLKALQVAEDGCEFNGEQLRLTGFLDDNEALWETDFFGYPVYGNANMVKELFADKTIAVSCPIGDPVARKRMIISLSLANVTFPNLIHPSAIVSQRATLGIGNILSQGTVIQAGVNIGDFNTFNMLAAVGPLAQIQSFCTINSHTMIASGSLLSSYSYVGMGATIKQKTVVSQGTTLGANAFLNKTTPPWSTWVGVPAKQIAEKTPPFPDDLE